MCQLLAEANEAQPGFVLRVRKGERGRRAVVVGSLVGVVV